MPMPRFSVIIPTLNEEKFLPKLLSSLVNQTEQSFEVIVVDGKSKDKTILVAEAFRKKLPLKVIACERASLPMQRNLGAKEAKEEWLIFVDADTILLPYCIDRLDLFISQEHPQVFTTWSRPDSEIANDAIFTIMNVMTLEGSVLLKRPFVTPGSLTVIEKRTFESVGGYDEHHAFHEDVDLGLRLYQHNARLAILRETLYIWSMRRFRNEGTMKVIQQYARSALPIIFFRRPMKHMPGYIMGGHLYTDKKKRIRASALRMYEVKFRKLMKELFQ